ncbi:MAG: DUF4097 family beta strand repeat-containing protein [Oscillospiraceae bacterium]
MDTTPHVETNASLASFTNIDIQVPNADVQLKKGDAFGIELTTYNNTSPLSYNVQDNTLTVLGEENDNFFQWLNLNFTFRNYNSLVVVYLPENFGFETVSIQNRSNGDQRSAPRAVRCCSYGACYGRNRS